MWLRLIFVKAELRHASHARQLRYQRRCQHVNEGRIASERRLKLQNSIDLLVTLLSFAQLIDKQLILLNFPVQQLGQLIDL